MKTTALPEPPIDLARWTPVHTERPSQDRGPAVEQTSPTSSAEPAAEPPRRSRRGVTVVVGAAIIADGRVLACARSSPPESAGKWEFPGGKVEPGETEPDALVRECAEELAVRIEVGDRVGRNVRMSHGRGVLKVYAARLLGDAVPQPLEHAELRWLTADELESVPWMPADVPVVAALRPFLLRITAEQEQARRQKQENGPRGQERDRATPQERGGPALPRLSPSGPDGRS